MEDVRKTVSQFPDGRRIAIYRNGPVVAERPHIVKAVEVVRVGMGKEYGVKRSKARGNGLEAEFGTGINDDPPTLLSFNI
jgi:hypothetical protein